MKPMRAVVITKPGGPEVLEIEDVETPEPIGDYVRVRIRASGVNRADLMQRAGGYPAPPGAPADIPGLELAGEVVDAGDVIRFTAGDRVMALVGGGGHAELAAVHSRLLAPVPDALDWDAAGGFVE